MAVARDLEQQVNSPDGSVHRIIDGYVHITISSQGIDVLFTRFWAYSPSQPSPPLYKATAVTGNISLEIVPSSWKIGDVFCLDSMKYVVQENNLDVDRRVYSFKAFKHPE